MSMVAPALGYFNTGTTVGAQIGAAGPRSLYGIISTLTGGSCIIYDGTSTSGTVLYNKSLTLGDVVHFGGLGIRAKNGLFIAVTGSVNVIYS